MINRNEYQHMRRYVEGRMSPTESVQFESEMSSDGFLADAVDGFKTDPGAFDDMPQFSRPSFSWMYVLGALGIVALFAWLPSEPELSSNQEIVILETSQVQEPLNDFEPKKLLPAVSQIETPIVELVPVEHILEEKVDVLLKLEEEELSESAVFLEAYMRPIELSEIAAFSPKELQDNTHIIYVQDLKIVRFSADTDGLERPLIAHESHLPASFESSAPESTKLEERLIKRVNKKSYSIELEHALIYFQDERFNEALGSFRKLDSDYGQNVNHVFYEGLCLYQMGSYVEASSHFSSVEEDLIQSFRQEASWYHALSLQALGDKEEALQRFTEIYNDDGHYAPMAASRMAQIKWRRE